MQYGKDGDFNDPVVRCDSCGKMILVSKLKEMGACICGSRKVRNLRGYDGKERDLMVEWGVDPEFLALFEQIDDRGIAA